MIKAGIIGVTGYTGIELLRLLQNHPHVKVTHAFTDSYVGQDISDVYPHLQGNTSLKGEQYALPSIINECDVVFISLPHGHAIDIVQPLLAAGKKIIDLGPDFRLKNSVHYQQWYQSKVASRELLQQAVYGLPEKGDRESIKNASLVANPGCYPTAIILAALPALKAGIVDINDCIFDAKSGISGAGRSLSLQSHYCEVTENLAPYQIGGAHRHTPEIEQELSLISQQSMKVQFTPHLVPMIRGLLVTSYLKLLSPLSQENVNKIYQETYQHEFFIRICTKVPQAKQVRGTNYCDIGIYVDAHTNRLIVISTIDNLIKGASGQAIQNMNLMFQLPENSGLNDHVTMYP